MRRIRARIPPHPALIWGWKAAGESTALPRPEAPWAALGDCNGAAARAALVAALCTRGACRSCRPPTLARLPIASPSAGGCRQLFSLSWQPHVAACGRGPWQLSQAAAALLAALAAAAPVAAGGGTPCWPPWLLCLRQLLLLAALRPEICRPWQC